MTPDQYIANCYYKYFIFYKICRFHFIVDKELAKMNMIILGEVFMRAHYTSFNFEK